jgi:hypothetical protein
MTFQIELVGGPLDGKHYALDDVNDYPPRVMFHVKPSRGEIEECTMGETAPVMRAVYTKRPREARKLAVYYDFDGIN